MAHVSVRPSWLTDPMLAEMRVIRDTSEDKPSLMEFVNVFVLDALADAQRGHGGVWPHDWVLSTNHPKTDVFLTPAGHAALHAIELEEASPINVDGTLKGEIKHVTLSSEIMSGLLHPDEAERLVIDDYAGGFAKMPLRSEFDRLPGETDTAFRARRKAIKATLDGGIVVTVTKTEALPPLPEPKNLWDRFNNEAQRACLNPAMEIGATKLSEPDKLTCMQALSEDRAHRIARKFDIDPTKISVTVTTNGMGFYDVKIEIDPMLGLAMKETP